MDAGTLTALLGAAAALAGTVATYLNRDKDSVDRRLEVAFTANQELVDDIQTERDNLLRRVEALENDRDQDRKEMARLHDAMQGQAAEMYVLRQRDGDMQRWMADVMAWAAMAVGIIRSMDRTIDDPPHPPVYRGP